MTERDAAHTEQKIALMFPGQGSQFPGMAEDLVRGSATARRVLERADDILGYRLSAIMTQEDSPEIHRTVHTQPAVFVHSMAVLEMLKDEMPPAPCIAAGHSLGEYSALVAAGVLSFDEALRVIKTRAEAMDSAQSPGTCGMAALVGPKKADIQDMLDAHRGQEVLEAANFNAPDQTVVSGHLTAVNRLVDAVKERKRTRAVMLPVSSAFHTSLMEPAQEPVSTRLESVTISPGQFPVVANVDAKARGEDGYGPTLLVDQIVMPVRWYECVETMREHGVTRFLEIGPGKVLTGLLRRIDRKAEGVNIKDLDSIHSFLGESHAQ